MLTEDFIMKFGVDRTFGGLLKSRVIRNGAFGPPVHIINIMLIFNGVI